MVSQPRYTLARISLPERARSFLTKVFFAELVASLHREGKTASSYLQELYDRYICAYVWRYLATLLIPHHHQIRLFPGRARFRSNQHIASLKSSPETNNSYFICDDPVVIDRIFARLRNYDGRVSCPL
jgi:hypothetical protein